MDHARAGIDEAFAAAQRQLDDVVRQARQNTERARMLADDVQTVAAESSSLGGGVTVRAGAGGRVLGIVFAGDAETMPLDDLAELTVRTIAQAQHAAMVALADRGADLFGEDSAIAQDLRRDAERGYGRGEL